MLDKTIRRAARQAAVLEQPPSRRHRQSRHPPPCHQSATRGGACRHALVSRTPLGLAGPPHSRRKPKINPTGLAKIDRKWIDIGSHSRIVSTAAVPQRVESVLNDRPRGN
jgi:hypothetical protein